MAEDAAATKLQGQARKKQAKAVLAAKREENAPVGSVFELFDTDKSGRLSALEFCAGIEVILERTKTLEEKQAVHSFVGTSSTLWNMMSQDAGWGADIPVAQLPHCTPELWKKYLDAHSAQNTAFLKFAEGFFKVPHQLKRRLLSQEIKRRAQVRLESTKRGAGDLFDLMDTDKSGTLSVKEVDSTIATLSDYKVDCGPWRLLEGDLYMRMAQKAWGSKIVPKTQLPHLTRIEFDDHMAEFAEKLAPFAKAVAAVMDKSASIQADAGRRVAMGAV